MDPPPLCKDIPRRPGIRDMNFAIVAVRLPALISASFSPKPLRGAARTTALAGGRRQGLHFAGNVARRRGFLRGAWQIGDLGDRGCGEHVKQVRAVTIEAARLRLETVQFRLVTGLGRRTGQAQQDILLVSRQGRVARRQACRE